MDYAWIWGRLVPRPQYTGSIGTPTFKWTDDRPQPTEEECKAEWKIIQKEQAKKKVKDKAYKEYITALNEGYKYNGVVYACDNKSLTNLINLHVIISQLEDIEENISVIDKFDNVHTLSLMRFHTLTYRIFYHVYELHEKYCESLKNKE